MTIRYLLDTNVISEPLRPNPNKHVLSRLKRHDGEIAIASLVWHELLFGCRRLPDSVKRVAIQTYLEKTVAGTLPILPYDTEAASWHASERVRLAANGLTPPFIDGQIAAIAFVNRLTLITFNAADYKAFKNLSIADWR